MLSLLFLRQSPAQMPVPKMRDIALYGLRQVNDSVIVFYGACQSRSFFRLTAMPVFQTVRTERTPAPVIPTLPVQKKSRFLRIKGSITYDFSYRSFVDTPYLQNDLRQHTLQAGLQLLFDNRYSVQVAFTQRFSNSPFFANVTDLNVGFRKYDLLQNEKAQLMQQLENYFDASLFDDPEKRLREGIHQQYRDIRQGLLQRRYDSLLQRYASARSKVKELESVAAAKNFSQQAVEERETALRTSSSPETSGIVSRQSWTETVKAIQQKQTDVAAGGVKSDTAKKRPDSAFYQTVADSRKKLALYRDSMNKALTGIRVFQQKLRDSLVVLRRQIHNISNSDSLVAYSRRNCPGGEKLSGFRKLLLSVNQLSIGRSWVDYSELTVKNIAISGINLEMNPGNIYFAAASGKLNYRFRDFIYRGTNDIASSQHLNVVRGGYGRKEGNHLIATFYTGRKTVTNALRPVDSSDLNTISGIAVEGRLDLNRNHYIVAELARSSVSGPRAPANADTKGIFSFGSHRNEAWSVQAYHRIPATATSIRYFYRNTGEEFQSFSLYRANASQHAWGIQLDQELYKKRILLNASVKKNEFNSPIAAPSFSSASTLTSLRLSIRVPKYPFITLGYYPSSQLISFNNTVYESQYHTLNGIVSHNYKAGGLYMNSNFVYTRFYNNDTDSGFSYYNATTFALAHSVFLEHVSFQGGVTVLQQPLLRMVTTELGGTYDHGKLVSVSAALRQTSASENKGLWSGSASLTLFPGKPASFQLQYDKSYLPAATRQLVPIDFGRLTYRQTL